MSANGPRTKLASIAAAALVALAIVPALAATAGAAPMAAAPAAPSGPSSAWAYGGQGWGSGGLTVGPVTYAWNASFGGVVIFNATNTSNTTTMLHASRTVGVWINASYAGPNLSLAYHYHALEVDNAYANVTTAATVTLANASVVPALGILNASANAKAGLQASVTGTMGNESADAYLNVTGTAQAALAFSPALGLIPLNLTGVSSWAASAMVSGNASWNLGWNWSAHGWNGTTASGSNATGGNWSTATEVTVTGHLVGVSTRFADHHPRLAILLGFSGPFDLYDGFVLIPHGFDLFGAGGRVFGSHALGASAIASEYVFVNEGRVAPQSISAANATLGGSVAIPTALTTGGGATSPAASPSATPGATLWMQPETPSAAQAQANCLQFGCSGTASLGLLAPIAVAAAAIAAVVGVVAWRSRRRRAPPAATATSPSAVSPAGADIPLRPQP